MNISTCEDQTASGPAAGAAVAQPANRDGGASTLIEFPVAGRGPRPQWRKDLSERVREIQHRRAVEASRESEESARDSYAPAAWGETDANALAPQLGLGLVPTPEPTEVNPIVAKALERIERARKASAPRQNARNGSAATAAAVARDPEEFAHAAQPTAAAAEPVAATCEAAEVAPADSAGDEQTAEPVETARAHNLVVVPSPPPPQSETDAAISEALNRPRPRRHLPQVADDALLTRREAEIMPAVVSEPSAAPSERAPVTRRVAAALIDLLIVAFASSPFAAVIELTSGDWCDPRVAGCVAGVVLTIMFLYHTVAVAFSGRTWGMRLISLRVVDARTGLIPTAGQCARRALLYMLSLATLGVGLLLALFDSEGRAAHDHLSRTTIVAE